MSAVMAVSRFVYARMVSWYPPALRAEYGEDMLDVFSENVEAAWRRASWKGVARAWLAVTRELAGIVLPYRTSRAIPALLAVGLSIVFYGSMLLAIDPNRYCHK